MVLNTTLQLQNQLFSKGESVEPSSAEGITQPYQAPRQIHSPPSPVRSGIGLFMPGNWHYLLKPFDVRHTHKGQIWSVHDCEAGWERCTQTHAVFYHITQTLCARSEYTVIFQHINCENNTKLTWFWPKTFRIRFFS